MEERPKLIEVPPHASGDTKAHKHLGYRAPGQNRWIQHAFLEFSPQAYRIRPDVVRPLRSRHQAYKLVLLVKGKA